MEIHFPHLTRKIASAPKRRKLITPKRLLKTTFALVMCSAAMMLAACNISGSGY